MLDKNGFQKKTYADLLDDMNAKAKELFGEDTRVTSDGFLGIFIKLYAWFLTVIWELAERVYFSGFLSDAEGVQLDRLGGNRGITREPASESYVDITITGKPGFLVETETQFTTESDIYFFLIEDVLLDAGGTGTGQAVCMTKGAIGNVAANTIVLQAEPVEEIETVTNAAGATGGMDEETDSQYRARIRQNNEGSGKAIPNAIVSSLLNTTAVRSATVIWNSTNEVDGEGNVPHSIHAYVLGGKPEDIAAALFDSVAGGINYNGNTAVTVKDIAGMDHEVKFDMATEVPIYLQLSITTDLEFEKDGALQIKDNIVNKIGGVDSRGVQITGSQMGQPVILSQLFNAVYQVNGITDVTITIGRSLDALSDVNISIAPREVAQTTVDNIEVIVDGVSQ